MKEITLVSSGKEDWVDRGKRWEEDSPLHIPFCTI